MTLSQYRTPPSSIRKFSTGHRLASESPVPVAPLAQYRTPPQYRTSRSSLPHEARLQLRPLLLVAPHAISVPDFSQHHT
eukprot:3677535-Rhodomonas_salina.1